MTQRLILTGFILATLSTLLCSCVGVGKNFSTAAVDALDLGQLKNQINFEPFGRAYGRSTLMKTDGKFEFALYIYTKAGFSKIYGSLLAIEFRNAKLNAFIHVRDFPEDKTTVDFSQVEKLGSGLGKLTRSDVLSALGKPHGKAVCPTYHPTYRPYCQSNNVEIWAWSSPGPRGPGSITTTNLLVCFDYDGKVTEIGVREFNYRSR
jgi:hypothetical protein